jgi:hypothetical protein
MRNALLFLQKLEEAFPRKVLRERHALMVIDNEGNPALQVCLGGYRDPGDYWATWFLSPEDYDRPIADLVQEIVQSAAERRVTQIVVDQDATNQEDE